MVFKLNLTAVKLVHEGGLVDWLQSYHAVPSYIAYPIILQIIAPGSMGEETLVIEDKILIGSLQETQIIKVNFSTLEQSHPIIIH
jgi:hypothetical protein